MKRREFLQLAHTLNDKHKIAGWYVSEKLDGSRCFWDGGLSRGMPTIEVPYASVIDPKTGKRKAKIKPVATGLWSRYGNPIMAPDWFLDLLPPCPLDGELWAGRGNFQLCRSIVAGDDPDPRFDQITYAVYGSPPFGHVFLGGEIKNSNFHCEINGDKVRLWCEWLDIKHKKRFTNTKFYPSGDFEGELDFLRTMIPRNKPVRLHPQIKLPDTEEPARKQLEIFLQDVVDDGGEGVIVRDPKAAWIPKRSHSILKYKPYLDDEAVIVGYVAGKEGKTGQMLGKIGALIVRWGEKEFEIGTGMTHEEREFDSGAIRRSMVPGQRIERINGKHLKLGQQITFKYRELTDEGIPKEARYWRAA